MAPGKVGEPTSVLLSAPRELVEGTEQGVAPSISESSLWMLSGEQLVMR